MKFFLNVFVLISIIALVIAAPTPQLIFDSPQPPVAAVTTADSNVQLLKYESYPTQDGHKFSYETTDGQFREETLTINNRGTDDEYISVIGSYSFIGDNNKSYVVRYTADKNGYNAKFTET